MTAPSTADTVPTAPEAAVEPPPAPEALLVATTAPEPPAPPAKRSLEDSLAALDPDTRAFVLSELTSARKEAKNLRERVKESDPAKIKAEIASAVAKAMGIESDQPADPAELAKQIAAEKETARQARVELAIFHAAGAAEADPRALLDSVSFMRELASVDPTDANAVLEAIKAAVEANPTLKTATRRIPAPNPAQGSSASGSGGVPGQLTQADVKKLYAEKKYAEIEKARVEGRLNTVLGIT